MRPIYSVRELLSAEALSRLTLREYELMARAVRGISVRIAALINQQRGSIPGAQVLVLVGPGDNGGDALWAAAELAQRGAVVEAVRITPIVHEEALRRFEKAGGRFTTEWDKSRYDLTLDGMFGAQGRPGLDGLAAELARFTRQDSAGLVVAIDVPSGMSAGTGEVGDLFVAADITLCIGALKPGLLFGNVGVLDVVPIDIELPAAKGHAVDLTDIATEFAAPAPSAHKYNRGVVAVLAGSAGYLGAAVLAVAGARNSGAGLVRYHGPAPVVETYPDVVTQPGRADAVLIGPGGLGHVTGLADVLNVDVPLVIDAAALEQLTDSQLIELIRQRRRPTLLTPHAGEAKRLGFNGPDRLEVAKAMSVHFSCGVLLKGPGTVLAVPDGRYWIDTLGSAALATAGSGDVLAGLVAGTLARDHASGRESWPSVACAVGLHGLAGRLAGACPTAADIAAAVPAAVALARQ